MPHFVVFVLFFTLFLSVCRSINKTEELNESVKLAYLAYEVPVLSDNTVPIIILHGLLGSKNNWNSMSRAMLKSTNHRKIYAIDARNHGDSPHTDGFTYDLMVSDVVKFLKEQNIYKASFIGHSLGGRVSMKLALVYPKLVHSLVIVDISPISQSPNMLGLMKVFNAIKNLGLDPMMSLSEARRRAGSQLIDHLKDEKLVAFILTNLIENKGDSNWRWKFNIDSITKNFEKEICQSPIDPNLRFNDRTLFIAGNNSDYVKKEDIPGIKKIFPAAKFYFVSDAGHWVHAEKPQEFLNVVTEFLNKDQRIAH